MLRLADPVLVVLVGPSASGKSTWANEHAAPDAVVSSDRLRAIVGESERDLTASADAFGLLEAIVAARMRRRLMTVVDSMGLDPSFRARMRALAAAEGVPCFAVYFDASPQECRRRNGEREHPLPGRVLAGQLRDFTAARAHLDAEGFDDVLPAQPIRVVAPSMLPGAAAGGESTSVANVDPPADRPRFGLYLSTFDVPGGPATWPERIRDVASRAEQAGFSSLWVMDHMRQIPQLGRAWDDLPESTAALGFLAAATTTASIGCLVHCVTYRNVAHLGKILATLDVLSGGRAWCGLGAGWCEAEHRAYGWPFPPARERLDLLEDALIALPLLWGPGSPSFSGRRARIPEALCYPRPLAGRMPILVGGSGEQRTLRLAAAHADACNLTGDAETVRRKVGVLHRHCADVGRDPADVEVTHLSTALVADEPASLAAELRRRRPARGHARWDAWHHPGTVADHVERVGSLAAAGVQHVIVSLTGVWDSPAIECYARVIEATAGSRTGREHRSRSAAPRPC